MRFDLIREANGVEQRLTKPNHGWGREDQATVRGTVFLSGGRVEQMNRTIKKATVERFRYNSYDRSRPRLADFVAA